MRSPIAGSRLAALFGLLTAAPLVGLGWLGWRVADQDRMLEHQRVLEQLQQSTSVLVDEFDRGLTLWDTRATAASQGAPAPMPPNLALIQFSASGVVRRAGLALPFYPSAATAVGSVGSKFDGAEADEFRPGGDPRRAETAYRRLASDPDPQTRAGALVRLARCLSRQGRVTEALATYTQLGALGDVPVAGAPAALVARRERLRILASRDPPAAASEATGLAAILRAGQFQIDRATFDVYAAAAGRVRLDPRVESIADAAELMWPSWQSTDQGREVVVTPDGPLVAVWRRTASGAAALIGPLDELTGVAQPVAKRLAVVFALNDPSGRRLWGPSLSGPTVVTSSSRETGLPWSMQVAPADGPSQDPMRSRATLLAAGFALMSVVVIAASYVGYRAVSRELGVARLQSDFVATVSHEFRTPLTAMRHLTEVLADGRAEPQRLAAYYGALARETRRLHTMVESLLDFGRIEAGRREYRKEETDAADLARHVVGEFDEHAAAHRLAVGASVEGIRISADREALALALRNLVDNAIKYSPKDSPVTVSVARRGLSVELSVEDRGRGMPAAEQRRVFRKFVRGSAAAEFQVKGTGLGLAMADRIVRAHNGQLRVWSQVGVGSRFTILLPTLEA